jgi:hypothetical protein
MIGDMSRPRFILATSFGICYAAFLIASGYRELLFGFRRRIDLEVHGILLTSSLIAGITAGIVASRLSRRTLSSVATVILWSVAGILIVSALIPQVNGVSTPTGDLQIMCVGAMTAWAASLIVRLAFRHK